MAVGTYETTHEKILESGKQLFLKMAMNAQIFGSFARVRGLRLEHTIGTLKIRRHCSRHWLSLLSRGFVKGMMLQESDALIIYLLTT